MKIQDASADHTLYAVRMKDDRQDVWVEVRKFEPTDIKVWVFGNNGQTFSFLLSTEAATSLADSLSAAACIASSEKETA